MWSSMRSTPCCGGTGACRPSASSSASARRRGAIPGGWASPPPSATPRPPGAFWRRAAAGPPSSPSARAAGRSGASPWSTSSTPTPRPTRASTIVQALPVLEEPTDTAPKAADPGIGYIFEHTRGKKCLIFYQLPGGVRGRLPEPAPVLRGKP